MKRQQPDGEVLSQLISEAAELEKWDLFGKSEFGTKFIKYLNQAIDETVQDEDRFDVYKVDDTKIIYHLAAVRSKRQTLNAIKRKILEAGDKKKEIMEEVNKYKT
jgi:hypothetical protein